MSKQQDVDRKNAARASRRSFERSPAGALLIFVVLILAVIGLYILAGKAEDAKRKTQTEKYEPSVEETTTPVIDNESEEAESFVYENAYEVNPVWEDEAEPGGDPVTEARYDNSVMLQCDAGRGTTLRIGLGRNVYGDGIYLNPTLIDPLELDSDEAYVFIIRASSGYVDYNGVPAARDSESYAGVKYFLAAERTYDKLVPASYASESAYGVKWADEWGSTRTATLYIEAIRLSDGTLMGTGVAEIVFDETEACYKVDSLERSDVSVDGAVSAKTRSEFITAAANFLNDDGNRKIDIEISDIDLKNAYNKIVVERRDWFVYGRFFDAAGNVVSAGDRTRMRGEIYAVHIPHFGHGFLTVYITAKANTSGFNAVYLDGDNSSEYAIIGYDALTPFTVSTFNARLLPDDREAFGVS